MTDHMGRTLADAIKAAAKLKGELPHIVQVYPSDYDTIIMAAEIERLQEAIERQASAIRTLHANEQTEINTLRKKRHEWHHAVSSLDSEREANARLTDEVERLTAERDALAGIVRGWHWLAVGPDEMGDYLHQRELIKASEPYASPALRAIAAGTHKKQTDDL
jgi:hypothetical protein